MPPKVEFGIWGRTLGLFGVALLPLFGIVCFFYPGGTGNGAYGIIVGVVGTVVLWPVWHFKMLLYFTQVYWLMCLLMAGASVYPYFQVPTLLPGVVMSLSAILYLIAAIRCEKHLTVEDLAAADNTLWMKM